MSAHELTCWLEFYRQQPFDDFNRLHRPAAMVAHAMNGAPLDDLLAWLAPPAPEALPDGVSSADMATLHALGLKHPTEEPRIAAGS